MRPAPTAALAISRACASRRWPRFRPTSSRPSTTPRSPSSKRSGWTCCCPRRAAAAQGRRCRGRGRGQRVRMARELVLDAVDLARPASPARPQPCPRRQLGGDLIAFSHVSSAPNCSDLDRGRRPGSQEDFRNFLKLIQQLNMMHLIGGYPVEPVDVHPNLRHLECIRDFVDADRQGLPRLFAGLGPDPRRDRDGPHRPRHRPRAAAEREPSLFTVINSSSPLRSIRRWPPASSRCRPRARS